MKWLYEDKTSSRRAGRETLSTRVMFTQSDVRKAVQALYEAEKSFKLGYTEPEIKDSLLVYLPCIKFMLDNFRQRLSTWAFNVAKDHKWIYTSDAIKEPTYFIDRRVMEVRPGPRSTKNVELL